MNNLSEKIQVDQNTGCWNWIACGERNVYGSLKVNGKKVDAHRFSFTFYKGEIPKGMYVCHTCDNRRCINPAHLFLGTPKDNHADGVAKGRIVSKGLPRKHPSNGSYKRGCRCSECLEFNRLRIAKYRSK